MGFLKRTRIDYTQAWLDNMLVNSNVDALSPDACVKISFFVTCVKMLANTIASLPIKINNENRISDKNRLSSVNNLQFIIKNKTNYEESAFEFWQKVILKICIFGNCFVEILRNSNQEIVALKVIDDELLSFTSNGYQFVTDKRVIKSNNIIHFKYLHFGDNRLSPVKILCKPLSLLAKIKKLLLSENKFAYIKIPERSVDKQQIIGLRNNLTNLGYKAFSLEKDVDIVFSQGKTAIQERLDQIQKMSREEIATFFGIPLGLLGDGATQNGVLDSQNKQFLMYGINPILVNIEKKLENSLLSRDEILKGVNIRFNRNALLQINPSDRANFYDVMKNNLGIYTDEMIKKIEDIE